MRQGRARGVHVECLDVDLVNDVNPATGAVRKEEENRFNIMNDGAFRSLSDRCASGEFDICVAGFVRGATPLRDLVDAFAQSLDVVVNDEALVIGISVPREHREIPGQANDQEDTDPTDQFDPQ